MHSAIVAINLHPSNSNRHEVAELSQKLIRRPAVQKAASYLTFVVTRADLVLIPLLVKITLGFCHQRNRVTMHAQKTSVGADELTNLLLIWTQAVVNHM